MKSKSFIKKSFSDLYRNPIIVLPTLVLLGFMTILSQISLKINYALTTQTTVSLWFVFFTLSTLLASSFVLSGLIGMSAQLIKKKKLSFIEPAKRFWFKNFIVIVIILLSYDILLLLSRTILSTIGSSIGIPLNVAQFIFFLVLFAILAGFMIFFTYTSFFLVILNKTIKESIKGSFKFTKNNYLVTLGIIVGFFAISQLAKLGGQGFFEIINALILVPYLSIILSRLIIEK